MSISTAPSYWRIEAAGAVSGVGTRCWQSAASWIGGQRRHRRQVIESVGNEPVTLAACEEVAQGAQGTLRLSRLLSVAIADMIGNHSQTGGEQMHRPIVLLALPATLNEAKGTEVWDLTKQELIDYGLGGIVDDSRCYMFMHGPIAGMRALGALFTQKDWAKGPVILAGVDSLADLGRLTADYAAGRVMTTSESNGWVAGEAAAALLLKADASIRAASNRQWAFHRPSSVQGKLPHLGNLEPPPSDAMAMAVQQALGNALWQGKHAGILLSDHDGSNWRALVQSAARTRVSNELAAPEWLPASVTGQVGAATAPLHWALSAARLRFDRNPPNSILSTVLDHGLWAGAVAMERTLIHQ